MAENYKDAHLQWIANNPKFVPQYPPRGLTYLEVMKSLYSQPEWNRIVDGKDVMNEMALAMFVTDKKWQLMSTKISKMVDKKVKELIPLPADGWFLTINFNHNTWSIPKCVVAIQNIINMKWVTRCKANFEYHVEGGYHPHCHFYLETSEKRARILEKVWRPDYIQEIVGGKNFIQLDPGKTQHEDKYIVLDKKDEKMEYVEKDIQWRKENNIPDFEKNW